MRLQILLLVLTSCGFIACAEAPEPYRVSGSGNLGGTEHAGASDSSSLTADDLNAADDMDLPPLGAASSSGDVVIVIPADGSAPEIPGGASLAAMQSIASSTIDASTLAPARKTSLKSAVQNLMQLSTQGTAAELNDAHSALESAAGVAAGNAQNRIGNKLVDAVKSADSAAVKAAVSEIILATR